MKFHTDGTLPQNDEVFVFGSNLAGAHGAGAAKVAREKYGAQMGIGVGFQGHSYAIPTKDHSIETLDVEDIKQYVSRFLEVAADYPEKSFFVTRIGCGLAGYADADIAPLFNGAPANCSFANEWRKYL